MPSADFPKVGDIARRKDQREITAEVIGLKMWVAIVRLPSGKTRYWPYEDFTVTRLESHS